MWGFLFFSIVLRQCLHLLPESVCHRFCDKVRYRQQAHHVTHPSETIFDLGLMGSLAGLSKGFMLPLGLSFAGVNETLRKGDENITKFADQIIRNPSDLGHLVRGAAMTAKDWFD